MPGYAQERSKGDRKYRSCLQNEADSFSGGKERGYHPHTQEERNYHASFSLLIFLEKREHDPDNGQRKKEFSP